MPLLTTTTLTNATIADLGRTIASHLAAAANAANRQAAAVLALSNDDLAAWINEQGEDAETLFEAHATLGTHINAASNLAYDIMAASDIPVPLGVVDLRSVPEKLASQWREIVLTENGATVVDIPQPEPVEEEP
jgi:hypothetical protein